MNELTIVNAIGELQKYLAEHEIVVEQRLDFSEFKKIAKIVRSSPLSAEFGSDSFDLHQETGIWTIGRHKEEPISVHATRYENIGDRCLGDHINNQSPRVYPGKHKLGKNHAPLMQLISGHVCYSGEFAVLKKHGGKALAGPLVATNFFLTLLRWRQVDWIWGLMDEELAKNGMASRIGFTYTAPNGVHWKKSPKRVSTNDWLVAVDRMHLYYWADIIVKRGVGSLLRK